MLRPEQMSRVSVIGSQRVMNDVIETIHELNLLHINDYNGEWDGFEPGNPIEGAEEASQKLVTVRSLQSILNIGEDQSAPTRIVPKKDLAENLETVRQEVNRLDDRRNELQDDLRTTRELIEMAEPVATIGIDLDLLSGYESLSVMVGEGDEEAIRQILNENPEVEAFETYREGTYIAVVVYPTTVSIEDVLVQTDFTKYEIPGAADGSPQEYVADLRQREQQLISELQNVEEELEDVGNEWAGFLLSAEEILSIEVQKREAPLSFATTENAFVAEGWVPTERVDELRRALQNAVGEHFEFEELERADYDDHGHPTDQESITESEIQSPGEDLQEEPTTDGGLVPIGRNAPPVVQDNVAPVKPFEALVEVINRPKYGEFDPTVLLFLTFPLFFGFMIGDLGYGLLYMGIGYVLFTRAKGDIMRSLGGVALWAGGFTALFGILYGEMFGLEAVAKTLWDGHPPLRKGLRPANANWALFWLVMSLLAGIVHLSIGWILDFYQNLEHGFIDAMLESGSWLMMLFGLWAWIFSGASGSAPEILVGSQSVFNGNPIPLGFTGFPEGVGSVGLAVFVVGLFLLIYGDPIESVEFLNVLVNVLSYTRMAAVLLAKAGMAFVVNLLFFGAYVENGEFHFMINHGPQYVMEHTPEAEIMFDGLAHGGIAGVVGGLVILIIGHLLVLVLGITSAGLQAIRLEYVEFFSKFYEGGGKPYQPFGHDRQYTKEHT